MSELTDSLRQWAHYYGADAFTEEDLSKAADLIEQLELQVKLLRVSGAEVLNNCMSELGYRSESLWVSTKISSGSLSFRESVERLSKDINKSKDLISSEANCSQAKESFVAGILWADAHPDWIDEDYDEAVNLHVEEIRKREL